MGHVLTEYRFAPPRRWMFDFCFPNERVAVEVEGGIWIQGRHSRGAGKLADMEKYSAAAAMGWRILYTTPEAINPKNISKLDSHFINQLQKALLYERHNTGNTGEQSTLDFDEPMGKG